MSKRGLLRNCEEFWCIRNRSPHTGGPGADQAWAAEGSPGLFVIDARVNPNLEAEWHQDAFKVSE